MTASSITPESILAALGDLLDPDNRRPLAAQGLIRDVKVENAVASLTLALTTHAGPLWNKLKADAVEKLRSRVPELQDVKVSIALHTRPPMELGKIGLRAKSVIAVGSGKGGVGKSTLCTSMAFGMARAGCSVGLMDADVYGPSLPHMLGGGKRPEIVERTAPDGSKVKRIIPIEARGLKVMSMGYLLEPETAVVWRGPMLHGAITQFLRDVEWGDLDYLFIDLPPGTGDIAITLSQLLPITGAVVVCTPQDVALIDAIRAVSMFRQVHIPVLGMVENMSFFLCPDNGKRYNIFGTGGVQKQAREMNVPVLGELPINMAIRERGDAGTMAGVYDEADSAPYLEQICFNLARNVSDAAKSAPSLPTL